MRKLGAIYFIINFPYLRRFVNSATAVTKTLLKEFKAVSQESRILYEIEEIW